MADETEKTTFSLDLDNAEFIKKLLESKGALTDLGKKENVSELIEGMLKVGEIAGTLGAAFFAVKGAMDVVFDAEQIKAVNAQFELLTTNAGISSEALKKGLTEAAAGLIDDTDLLKSANKALVEMGGSAKKLPEVLELARHAASIFGGTASERFEELNQAISTGNTRLLKHMGILIDQDKAYEKYAASIHTSVEALSASGKQQAIMNAVLAKGKEAFGDQDLNIKEATNAWTAFKVALTEIGEVATLLFEKTLGPVITKALVGLKDSAVIAKDWVKTAFGEGKESAEGRVELVHDQISRLQKQLLELKEGTSVFGAMMSGNQKSKSIENIQNQIKALEAEVPKAEAALAKLGGSKTPGTPQAKESSEDTKKAAEERAKFEKQLLALTEKRMKSEEELGMNDLKFQEQIAAQKVLIEKAADDKKAQLRLKLYHDGITDEKKLAQLTNEIDRDKTAKLKMIDDDLNKTRAKNLENYANHSKTVADGIVRSFAAASAKNKAQLMDFGHTGQQVFDNFAHNAVDAFKQMAAGQKNAGEAMKDMLLNSIGQTAEAKGTELFLSSVYPPNPVGLAAGGGLIAFGAFLQSQAGGSSLGGPGAGGGGGGGGMEGSGQQMTDFGTRTDEKPTLAQAQQQKQVTVQVQGNYFETEQTKTALVDLMRQATDATAFKYQQIGG